MCIDQLHANLCTSLINKCPNRLHIALNFINFDLNIFGALLPLPPPPPQKKEKEKELC